jgi:fructokinase
LILINGYGCKPARLNVPDIITFGEMLIDFVPTVSGVSLMDAPAFINAPGGATANVAVGVSRLGVSSGFMGKVGDDAFGRFLERTLHEANVDTTAMRFATDARTSLAFVSLRADGEREFVFYRHMDKDLLLMYAPAEVDIDYIRGGKIFHYGSISLIDDTSRTATRLAVSTARSAGLTISYDPNLRLNLWPNADAAREGLLTGWRKAHIIKASEDEMTFLTGKTDLGAAVDQLWHSDLCLLVVTLGKHGCRYFTPNFNGEVASFDVAAVDTTGAGDGFVAGLLTGLHQHANALTDEATLRKICRRANAVGALTTTQRGAIPALPTTAQLDSFLDKQPHA